MVHDLADAAPASMRILIVDDDRSVLNSMKLLLKIEGHSVATAASGREALELFRAAGQAEPFDLVITDPRNAADGMGMRLRATSRPSRPRLP